MRSTALGERWRSRAPGQRGYAAARPLLSLFSSFGLSSAVLPLGRGLLQERWKGLIYLLRALLTGSASALGL